MKKMRVGRRDVLRSGALLGAGAVLPPWMPRMSFTAKNSGIRGDVLVVVFLRGAADGLNMIVPHGEEPYYQSRPTLAIPQPDARGSSQNARVIDLDGYFGLHPALRPIFPVWEQGHFIPVIACGAPDESRSHFKAMELMERGLTNERGPASGWIGRHLATLENGNPSPLRAVGFGEAAPKSLHGSIPITALKSITDFHLNGNEAMASRMRSVISSLYTGDQALHQIGRETLSVVDTIEKIYPSAEVASGMTDYPETDFGFGLRQIALLIDADVGLEVAALDLGGWDTHFTQGGSEGIMARLLAELGGGLAAFYDQLQDDMDNITVVVMTEFGRRVRENASLGTDHGHGSIMFLMGGNLHGSEVHGVWPGLDEGLLIGPGDLAVTTDYRDVLAEILVKRLHNHDVESVFPDYVPNIGNVIA
jgi:uncharacterized protein (DUF1501 family)